MSPSSPLRPCGAAGCPRLVRSGYCQVHARQRDQARGTARERGYTSRWDVASATYVRAHPTCVVCGMPSEVTDHIVPPKLWQATTPEAKREASRLFWDRSNWQALCQCCNKAKGIRNEGGFGRG